MKPLSRIAKQCLIVGSLSGIMVALVARASSHREAPQIASTPQLDGTDFYMFNSYEEGRSDFVTIIANYLPLQDPYGGPNYFALDPNALYEIHIDNDGDAREDITFQFQFSNTHKQIALPIGPPGDQRTNAVPVINVGAISASDTSALNRIEEYRLNIIRGLRRSGTSAAITRDGGLDVFGKPVDNIGNKSIPDYEAYSSSFLYTIDIPGCPTPGRVFVGQRKDPFVVNLGETFDLVNISNPLGPVAGEQDSLRDKNVTSLILEIPKECLVAEGASIIGGWTTASRITSTGTNQVSRLGQPLVNEVVIGLGEKAVPGVLDKDAFNAVEPAVPGDAVLIDYVTHPTLPAILELLFGGAGVRAPTNFPRSDLVTVFLTGIPGLNQTATPAEYLRLNTAIPAIPADQQNNLGVIAGDNAGFPNGRRPGDDVVDIALRVAMGKLLSTDDAPSGQLPFTDGAFVDATMFDSVFPYIKPPLPGSPNDFSVLVTLQSSTNAAGPFSDVQAIYNPLMRKLVTPRAAEGEQFFRLRQDTPTDKPLSFTGQVETVPNVQLGITR